MNLVLVYTRTQQWDLARKTVRIIFYDVLERRRIGETEIFVKLLGYNDGKSTVDDWMEKNRAFLGGKTLAKSMFSMLTKA